MSAELQAGHAASSSSSDGHEGIGVLRCHPWQKDTIATIREGTQLPRVPSELIEQIIHSDGLAALGAPKPAPTPTTNPQHQEPSHVR